MKLKGISNQGMKRLAKKAQEDKGRPVSYAQPPDQDTSDFEDKVWALATHLDISPVDITEGYTDNVYEAEGGEYLVLTDEEADEMFDEYMNSFIDEVILSELPEQYRYYFDEEKFKQDVKISDGRGPSLASYDGEENEVNMAGLGEWFYIYRTN